MTTENLFDFSLTREAEIPEGEYPYKIINIEVQHNVLTDYGVKQKISFYFELKIDEEIKNIEKSFYYSKYPTSRFMLFMTIICKAYNTKKLNLEELIGSYGTLSIAHGKDDDGNVFENITEIVPVLGKESKPETDINI